jgi:ABC-2 type transport system ATP-binding protein
MTDVEVRSLSKRFGRVLAVDDVTFTAPAGAITGFLGPNGAGKTTTLRIMLGLVGPTSGTALFGGRRYADLDHPRRRVGAVLEATGFHPARRARDHLRVLARIAGVPAVRVDEVLAMVRLERDADRRVGGFSLGMRQRLGLAGALLGDPSVLILDEPANGLDPAGIRWMRDLLRGYADGGGTVLLSSHLLHEIEIIADDLVLIGNGRIVAQGTKTALLQAAGTLVRAGDLDRLGQALEAAGLGVAPDGDGALRTDADPGLVGKVALEAGVALTELRAADGAGLEEMFLELTAETAREGAAA